MEVSTEISQKIRSAIKAKLMELGAYVDDELPDYIMVMVANKKSRSQMSSDLCLFLGTNTEAFTGWLHGLLGKLQTITVESSDKMKAKVPKDGKKKDKKDGKEKKKARTRKHSSESSKKKSEYSEKSETSQIESKQLASSEIIPEINTKTDTSSKSAMPTESSSSSPSGRMDLDSVEKDINLQEDVEDVRQLLVTGAQADELAEELETTEEEVKKTLSENSIIPKTVAASTKEKGIDNLTLKVRRSPTPDKLHSQVSAINRKRKGPISVVASVSRRTEHDNDEEEYDPYNPAVGNVASVVKVTSRKSSVPASLQANRALLLKAMSEAEKSISVKRKIAVTRPISRRDSPKEVYSPKRKRLDSSPPPYIPSRKDASSSNAGERHSLSYNDARRSLNRGDNRELVSRSRREELLKTIGLDRTLSASSDKVHSPEASRGENKHEKHDHIDRHVKGDTNVGAVKNFQITTRVASPQVIKTKASTAPTVEVKSSIASRLGKVILQRKSTDPRDARVDIEMSKSRQDAKEGNKKASAGIISRLGKAAVQKQCEAAVKSVKSSKSREMVKDNNSPDCRVVCCETESVETVMEEDSADVVVKREIKSSKDSLDVEEDMSDDLAHMLEDDLEPEVLEQHDEFTLDLEDDDDVVGVIEDEEMDRSVDKAGDTKAGTRFIVTLDGVDERQFDTSENPNLLRHAAVPETAMVIPIQTSELQKEKLILDLLTAQTRSAIQETILPLSQATQALASKLQPPKIQPFSINLKDSDDEHEEMNEAAFDPSLEAEDSLHSLLKKAKMSERCKFWPACAAGSACEYHHPTTHCKTFPNCKFGDKCLFIHPNCKFDSKCSRSDCPFTHTSRRPIISSATHVIALPQPRVIFSPSLATGTAQVTCRYFPNCYNVNCPFLHPKPCHFGAACKNSMCTFYHQPLPGRSKLKWQAQTDVSKVKLQTSQQEKPSASTLSPSHSTAVSSTSQ